MSVTNDPNYHEGQPVFGPTDAVRPTSETGAMRPSERSCHLAAQAWCQPETSGCVMDVRLAEAFARILDEQLGPRMPWSEMSGSEKEAVYNNAPRPLPDLFVPRLTKDEIDEEMVTAKMLPRTKYEFADAICRLIARKMRLVVKEW